MTTTSEKILSEMERMGRMKIKDLCAQMDWQYQKFRRRIKANDISDDEEDITQGNDGPTPDPNEGGENEE